MELRFRCAFVLYPFYIESEIPMRFYYDRALAVSASMFATRLGIHVRTTLSPNKYPQRQIEVSIEACISILYEITRAKLVLSIENYLHTGGKYRKKGLSGVA